VRLENIMSIVVVDIDNEYCDELLYSYQLCKDIDGTYSVYVSRDILRGYHACKEIETFFEAFKELQEAIMYNEGVTI
jgi:hypothetical protein